MVTGAVPCALQMGHFVVMFSLSVFYSDSLTSLQNFTSTHQWLGRGTLRNAITNGALCCYVPPLSYLSDWLTFHQNFTSTRQWLGRSPAQGNAPVLTARAGEEAIGGP